MRAKTRRFSGRFILSLFAMVVMLWKVGPVQAAEEIAKTIDKSNVAQYKEVLIPALYRAVERGDFILKTGKLDFEYKHWDKFLEAGEANAGKFDVNGYGDLIDKTGKIPYYNIYGYPFPHVDTKNDPKAAVKIMWNFIFSKYRIMCHHYSERVQWVNKEKGIHRYVVPSSYHLFLQGRPPKQAVSEQQNPEHYAVCELALILEPFSMRNTNQLNFDFLDEREIIMNAYVPVIRRIRQTSGVSRSDPYMGSDGWTDIAYMWAGKNRTMTWKLAGEQTILVPFSTTKKINARQDPDGTMYLTVPEIKFGYDTPGWKGVTWAPTTVTWIPRKVWIIEQMPKDPYYSWGLHINYVDKETSQIWMKEVYDKSGEFRTWVYVIQSYQVSVNGNNNIGVMDSQNEVDEKIRHSTVDVHQNPPGGQIAIYLPLSKTPMSMFTKSNLMALSK